MFFTPNHTHYSYWIETVEFNSDIHVHIVESTKYGENFIDTSGNRYPLGFVDRKEAISAAFEELKTSGKC